MPNSRHSPYPSPILHNFPQQRNPLIEKPFIRRLSQNSDYRRNSCHLTARSKVPPPPPPPPPPPLLLFRTATGARHRSRTPPLLSPLQSSSVQRERESSVAQPPPTLRSHHRLVVAAVHNAAISSSSSRWLLFGSPYTPRSSPPVQATARGSSCCTPPSPSGAVAVASLQNSSGHPPGLRAAAAVRPIQPLFVTKPTPKLLHPLSLIRVITTRRAPIDPHLHDWMQLHTITLLSPHELRTINCTN